nr:uncharacterized protein LOC129153061 [Nothobranchius furzeri]
MVLEDGRRPSTEERRCPSLHTCAAHVQVPLSLVGFLDRGGGSPAARTAAAAESEIRGRRSQGTERNTASRQSYSAPGRAGPRKKGIGSTLPCRAHSGPDWTALSPEAQHRLYLGVHFGHHHPRAFGINSFLICFCGCTACFVFRTYFNLLLILVAPSIHLDRVTRLHLQSGPGTPWSPAGRAGGGGRGEGGLELPSWDAAPATRTRISGGRRRRRSGSLLDTEFYLPELGSFCSSYQAQVLLQLPDPGSAPATRPRFCSSYQTQVLLQLPDPGSAPATRPRCCSSYHAQVLLQLGPALLQLPGPGSAPATRPRCCSSYQTRLYWGESVTMPPKRNNVAEEKLEEIKESLSFMSEEITTVSKQQKEIMELVEEVKVLRIKNEEEDRKITLLEERVSELEQYSIINDVIVTGLETTHQTYAKATATESGEPPEQELNNLERQGMDFLGSKGIHLEAKDIEGCHPLPRKNKNQKPAILIRFMNRKHKKELLKQGRKLKGTNELTPNQEKCRHCKASKTSEKAKENTVNMDFKL